MQNRWNFLKTGFYEGIKVGLERGVVVAFDEKRGKGSHGTLSYGRRKIIVKDRRKEVGAGLLAKMLRDLDLTLDDLSRTR